MSFRPLRAYRELNASLQELNEANAAAEQRERLALARSTTRFCHNSKKVVDDTMSLSAVLMRAGEVVEAKRLLAEVDRDVQQEKVALLEVMHEVDQQKAQRSHKMTRLRMAKMLMSAVLGASLMTFSAFGVALANYFTDRVDASERVVAGAPTAPTARDASRVLRHVELAPGVKFRFTPEQYEEYARLASEKGDPEKLESFLRDVLPAGMLDKLTSVLAAQGATVDSAVATVRSVVKKAPGSTSTQSSQTSGDPSGSGEGSSSSDPSSNDKERDEEDSSQNGSSEQGCEDDPKGGEEEGADRDLLGGNCIPIVNKESPV